MGFTFRAYELNIDSEFEPPGLIASGQPDATVDVRISTGEVAMSLGSPSIENSYYQVSTREFLLTIPNVARYYVAHGNEIVVSPQPGADPDKVRLFLHGSALGALLYQRGLFPLHGSAVVTRFGAMIFIGPQGIGKSTLAAHFQKRGYALMSDDVCAITTDRAGNFQVLPAFSQIRLCDDAYKRLELHRSSSASSRFDVDKFVVSQPSGHNHQVVNLCAVHLLSAWESEDIRSMPLKGFERVDILLENLYRPGYLRGFATKGHVMQEAAAIARQAFISKLFRPDNPDRIESVVDWLIDEWENNINYHQKGDLTATAE